MPFHFQGWVHPQMDMFASPRNTKLKKIHFQTPPLVGLGVDSLNCPLETITDCYANPLVSHRAVVTQVAPKPTNQVPYNPPLVGFHQLVAPSRKAARASLPIIPVLPQEGNFQNCQGQFMPRPRWPLICILLSGSCWKDKGSPVTPSITLLPSLF